MIKNEFGYSLIRTLTQPMNRQVRRFPVLTGIKSALSNVVRKYKDSENILYGSITIMLKSDGGFIKFKIPKDLVIYQGRLKTKLSYRLHEIAVKNQDE